MTELFSQPPVSNSQAIFREVGSQPDRIIAPQTSGYEGHNFPRLLHPSLREVFMATAHNTWWGALKNDPVRKFGSKVEPEYPGWHSRVKDTHYEAYANAGDHVHSYEDEQLLKNWLDGRRRERENLAAAAGTHFLMGSALMLADPSTWVGIGMINRMNKLKQAAFIRPEFRDAMKLSKIAGDEKGTRLKAGLIFGGTQLPGEMLRHTFDPTMTTQETAGILAASTVFGMLGGRSVSSFSKQAQAMEGALQYQERGFASMAEFKDLYDPRWFPGRVGPEDIYQRHSLKYEKNRSSVGAAQTGSGIEGPEGHMPVSNLMQNIHFTPQQRTLSSPFNMIGDISKRLFEVPWDTKAMQASVAHPPNVIANMRKYLLPVVEAMREQETAFMAHRMTEATSMVGRMAKVASISLRDRVKGAPPEKLTLPEFRERVGRAVATGERDAIEEVNRMALVWKEKVYDPLGDAAVAAGLLKEKKLHYLNRIWQHDSIKADRVRFEQMIKQFLEENPEHLALSGPWRAFKPGVGDVPKLSPATAARNITNMILTERPFTPLSEFEIGLASPLHKMAIKIPNNYRANNGAGVLDFMVTDIEAAARALNRQLTPDIELAKMFGKTSVDDTGKLVMTLEGAMDGVQLRTVTNDLIEDAFESMQKGLSARDIKKLDKILEKLLTGREALLKRAEKMVLDGNPVKARAIYDNKSQELIDDVIADALTIKSGPKGKDSPGRKIPVLMDNISDIHAMRDLLRGTFGQPNDPSRTLSRVLRTSRTFTAMTMLSGPLWSAVPDLAMPILHEGLTRTLGTSFSLLANSSRKQLYKMSRREIELAGEALDMELATRALAITDFADISGKFSLFERSVDSANSFAFVANLFNPWNSMMKGWAGTIIQSRILETTVQMHGKKSYARHIWQKNTGQRGLRNRNNLLRGTIDDDAAKIIAQQFEKYGKKEGNVWIARTEAWDLEDAAVRDAVDKFRSALSADIRRTIITPNKSDLPLWVSTEYGAVIASLKTFSFASIQRTLIPALQYKDKQAFIGVSMLTALGMFVDEMKRLQRGDRRPLSLAQRLQNGIERGGSLGPFMDVNRVIETVSNNKMGIGPVLGTTPDYDTSLGNKVGALGGAVATQGVRLADVMADVLTGNVDPSTMNSARRLFPLNQAPHFDGAIFQPIENSVSGAVQNQ